MSRLRTRQVSGFVLVSALSLALTLPASAQPFDRLDLASLWHSLHSWLRPEGTSRLSEIREAEVMAAGLTRDPDGAASVTPSPPEPEAIPESPTGDH